MQMGVQTAHIKNPRQNILLEVVVFLNPKSMKNAVFTV